MKGIVGKLCNRKKEGEKTSNFEMCAHWDALEGLEDLCISSVSAPPPTMWTKTDVLSRELGWVQLCPFSAPTVSTREMSNAVVFAKLPVEAHSNIVLFQRSFFSRRCGIMCVCFHYLSNLVSFQVLKDVQICGWVTTQDLATTYCDVCSRSSCSYNFLQSHFLNSICLK